MIVVGVNEQNFAELWPHLQHALAPNSTIQRVGMACPVPAVLRQMPVHSAVLGPAQQADLAQRLLHYAANYVYAPRAQVQGMHGLDAVALLASGRLTPGYIWRQLFSRDSVARVFLPTTAPEVWAQVLQASAAGAQRSVVLVDVESHAWADMHDQFLAYAQPWQQQLARPAIFQSAQLLGATSSRALAAELVRAAAPADMPAAAQQRLETSIDGALNEVVSANFGTQLQALPSSPAVSTMDAPLAFTPALDAATILQRIRALAPAKGRMLVLVPSHTAHALSELLAGHPDLLRSAPPSTLQASQSVMHALRSEGASEGSARSTLLPATPSATHSASALPKWSAWLGVQHAPRFLQRYPCLPAAQAVLSAQQSDQLLRAQLASMPGLGASQDAATAWEQWVYQHAAQAAVISGVQRAALLMGASFAAIRLCQASRAGAAAVAAGATLAGLHAITQPGSVVRQAAAGLDVLLHVRVAADEAALARSAARRQDP